MCGGTGGPAGFPPQVSPCDTSSGAQPLGPGDSRGFAVEAGAGMLAPPGVWQTAACDEGGCRVKPLTGAP